MRSSPGAPFRGLQPPTWLCVPDSWLLQGLQRKTSTRIRGCGAGRPAASPDRKTPQVRKKRGARGFYYVTTRVNLGKWEKQAGIRALKGFPSHFLGIFKRLGGTLPGFGAGGKGLFWQTNAKKRAFFSFNRRFWGLFLGQSNRLAGSQARRSVGCPGRPEADAVYL